jgi:hypothetical protein
MTNDGQTTKGGRLIHVPTSPTTGRDRDLAITAGQVLAGALLVAAATWMPWASLKVGSTGATTTFKGGLLGAVLAVLGLVSVVLAVTRVRLRSSALSIPTLLVACVALACSIVMALTKISSANNVPKPGGSETSYAYGAIVGVLASVALVALGVATLTRARQEVSEPD